MKSDEQKAKCLNCGEETGPRFCSHCGQEAQFRQGPVIGVAREVLSDWLSLDSRLLRSLGMLLRPGRLSELYVVGKRAPYLRPFRLYLLASLLLFSTALTLDVPDGANLTLKIGGEIVGPEADESVRRELEFLGDKSLLERWILEIAGDRVDRLRKLSRPVILEELFSGLRRMLPTTLIFFAPFLALALKLLYLRGKARRTLYLDHLVFALHFQSALFFAISAAWLATRAMGGGLFVYPGIILAMIVLYLPLSLRRFYGQSWLWTAVKALALLYVYSQLIGLAVNLSVLVGIWDV